jgi:dTDP-4-dehydrorhamnose reductase
MGILITGANGQVGWEIVRQASVAGIKHYALDRKALDVRDLDAVSRTVSQLAPTVVINAAAYTHVDQAESEAEVAFAVNRDGAMHLAKACADTGIPLVHISTDYVFDGRKSKPYTEEDLASPLGAYGESKFAGEEAIREYCPEHIILRTAWVYGIHGHNFVKTMLRLGHERERIKIVDDQFGNPTFARDFAAVVLELAQRSRSGSWLDEGFGTYHCAGSGVTTWCGFASAIFELAGSALERLPEIEAITTTDYSTLAERPAYSVLDCRRLARIHGIVMRPWRAALADMIMLALRRLPAREPGSVGGM